MNDRKATLLEELGRLIRTDSDVTCEPCDSLALVLQFDGPSSTGMSGYCFVSNGSRPFAPDSNFDPICDLADELYELSSAEGRPLQSLLVRMVGPDWSPAVEEEFKNRNRWQVTPANLDTMVESLRPKPGGD